MNEHGAVCLADQKARGHREVGGQLARVVDLAAGNDKTHMESVGDR